jgi:hypothetical protein
MHKVLKLALFLFFYSAPVFTSAQNKYAVLLAVNDYYAAPGEKHPSSLKGCVNDAESIRALLINRFGFDASNIHSLYDAAATKKNFIDLMLVVLRKCKPGDALVFYYSGHGVWMTNHELDQNLVKRGMSQAIVMSDLYSPGWDCLVRDETLKDIFNQYVNKKIIVTTIFDCCYSGNVMMKPKTKYWNPLLFQKHPVKKDLDINNIPYVPQIKKPIGCRNDATGQLLDTIDTDRDGFPDCMDWEVNSPLYSEVDSVGVTIYPDVEGFIDQHDNYYDSSKFENDSAGEMRSFNLKDALTVSNRSSVGPTQRDNSRFLSMSGTLDNEKGLEITDVSGMKHGAFTAAIVQVYRTNPPTLPANELMNRVTAIMQQQYYHQSPAFHYDPARGTGNLIGISPAGFSDKIKAVCLSNKNGVITIDKGMLAGVTKGNVFSDINLHGKQKVQIVSVFNDSATAIDKTNGQIKPGHVLEITDNLTVSAPLVKIFLPAAPFTPASFESFFKNKIGPLTKRSDYGDYNYSDDELSNTVMIWKDGSKFQKTENPNYANNPDKLLYVLLPAPSFIADRIKTFLLKDQNIEIVNDPAKADYGIYMNYAKPRGDTASEFVFYIHPVITGKTEYLVDLFSIDHITVSDLSLKNVPVITDNLMIHLKRIIRSRTNTWMNTQPRR